MKHVLRYHIRECMADNSISEIIKFSERTGCHEVLLFTSSYDFQPSFIPLNQLRSYANLMSKWGKQLEQAGINVNINVLQTLGHVNFPESDSVEFPFQRRVDSYGKQGQGGACPLDRSLQEYVGKLYEIFASLKPAVIYVDDDYRSLIDGMCCFCPKHMERIGQLLGRSITRDELLQGMMENDTADLNLYRNAFHESQVEGLCDLAETIRQAVDAISPETRIGLMTAKTPGALWGHDYLAVSKVLAGQKHRPLLRPQMPPYMESGDLHNCAGDFRQPAIVRELYDGKVDVQPEIENYTYTTYSKSARLTLLQMVIAHFDGCHEHLLNIFDMYNSPFSECEPLVRMLEDNKGMFEQLGKMIPEGYRNSGIAMWQHPKGHLCYRTGKKDGSMKSLLAKRNAEQYISLLGLPVGFEWEKSPFLMLCGDDIAALEKSELENLLNRNAIIDLSALQRIIEKGLGDVIGVGLGSEISRDQSTAEMFLDEDFCEECAGRLSPLHYFVHDGWCREVKPCNGTSARPLSVVVDNNGQKVTPLVSAIQTFKGRRFGILGFNINDVFRQIFVNSRRCKQIKNLFEWIAGEKLPIVATGHAFLVPQYLSFSEDNVMFALINYSLDDVTTAVLEAEILSSGLIKRLHSDGSWQRADDDFEHVGHGKYALNKSIGAFEFSIYRISAASAD